VLEKVAGDQDEVGLNLDRVMDGVGVGPGEVVSSLRETVLNLAQVDVGEVDEARPYRNTPER